MNQQFESICPACHSGTSKILWTVSAHEAAQHFVRAESDTERNADLATHISKLWGQATCAVMSCETCGLGFAHPFVAGDENFYNLAYPGTPEYPIDKWDFSRTILDLKSEYANRVTDVRCLELGSGIGNFLRKLTEIGIKAENIVALEYNAESLKVLEERGYQGKAAHVSAIEGETFDLIFMFQVLEHMDCLDDIFAKVTALLKQGGSLYLAVPNLNRTSFQERNNTLLDMPPNHISRWTKASFDAVLGRHGLHVKKFEVEAGSVLSICLQDLKYYTLRQSMFPNTLASRVYGARQSLKRKVALACVAVIYLFRRLPLWLGTAGSFHELGGSVWLKVVHGK